MSSKFYIALEAFMAKAQAKVTAQYLAFQGANTSAEFIAQHSPKLTYMAGKRYLRIVSYSTGSRCSFAFVDTTNGDVLKSASWKKPATNFPRGNIYDAQNGTGRVRWTGVQ
jgi:hypothetical protein